MAHLIDKDALVAEIDKRESILDIDSPFGIGGMIELNFVKDILNALEVKEVDIDKEIEQSFIDLDYHLDAYNRVEDYVGENLDMVEYKRIAKHFFELGLKVHKGE